MKIDSNICAIRILIHICKKSIINIYNLLYIYIHIQYILIDHTNIENVDEKPENVKWEKVLYYWCIYCAATTTTKEKSDHECDRSEHIQHKERMCTLISLCRHAISNFHTHYTLMCDMRIYESA